MAIICGGGPIGVYDVMYYHVRGGRVHREAGFDRGLSLAGARRALSSLGHDEIGVATCQSAPGSMTGYGSEHAQQAWAEATRREAIERLKDIERPWTLPDGTTVRVRHVERDKISVEINGEAATYRVDDMYPAAGLGEHVDAAWAAMRERAKRVLQAARDAA